MDYDKIEAVLKQLSEQLRDVDMPVASARTTDAAAALIRALRTECAELPALVEALKKIAQLQPGIRRRQKC
jgi:hypothetical protein